MQNAILQHTNVKFYISEMRQRNMLFIITIYLFIISTIKF